jgi:hypothetical protein
MNRIILLAFLTLMSLSFTTKTQDEVSPQGDSRMGADAATSGTDMDDKDIQSQEDQLSKPNSNQETEKKEIKTNGADDHGLPTN